MKIQHTTPPEGLLRKLESLRLKYTDAKFLYDVVWLWGEIYCGVFGDGPNGAYEFFIWEKKTGFAGFENLETSDCGYGSSAVALRDVLLLMDPIESRDAKRVRKQIQARAAAKKSSLAASVAELTAKA
jgi:hypothetical protein